MRVTTPNTINLLSSNVSESLHSEWDSGVTYSTGDRVYVTLESDGTTERTPHRIFESTAGSNTGNYPPDSPSQWVLVGSTNRWRMFDEFVSSQTANSGGIDVTVQTQGDRLAMLDVDANSVDFVFSSELGTLVDVAGGNDGTLVNGPTWVDEGPNDDIRGVLSFDGVGDRVDFGDVNDLVGSFTIEMWFKPTNIEAIDFQNLISKDDGNGWTLRLRSDNLLNFTHKQQVNDGFIRSPFGSVINDQWFHGAVVFDSSNNTLMLFLNGNEVDKQTNATNSISGNGSALQLSSPSFGNNAFANKSDARIWNTARTQQQIQDNKDKRLTGTESGLVGYWPATYEEKTVDLNDPFVTDWFEYFFAPIERRRSLAIDKPTLSIDRAQITVNNPNTAKVGTALIGDTVNIATATYGTQVAFEDFSRKETNDFGETTLIERASARLLNVPVFLTNDTPAEVIDRIAATRGTAVLWDANEQGSQFDALRTFGFFRDFNMNVNGLEDQTYNIEIRGLT